MTWTPEQLEKAKQYNALLARDNDADEAKAQLISDELEAQLGEDEFDRLAEYAESAQEPADSAPKGKAVEEPEADLLPFPEAPGYLLDSWGVPHRQKGKGRKAGRVPLEKFIVVTKGEKRAYVIRYRLTVNGKQQTFYPRYLQMARMFAEHHRRGDTPLVRRKSEKRG